MTKIELAAKVAEYKGLKTMMDELANEIEALGDEIKAEMGDEEVVYAGDFKLTYKPVTTKRVDTTALKKAMPDVAEQFTKETTARRFVVA